jgi:hypothetical protein
MFNNYNTGYDQNYFSQPMTNVTLVMSLEEALMRASSRNSDMVFFNQDKPIFYRVKIDNEGRKSWAQFDYTTQAQNENSYATKSDVQNIIERLTVLENSIKKEGISNE